MWPFVDEARGNDDNLRRSRFGSTVAAAAAAARYSRYRSIATWLGFPRRTAPAQRYQLVAAKADT